MHHPLRARPIRRAVLVPALLLAACASGEKRPTDLERLATATAELETNEYAAATERLERWVEPGQGESVDPSQRFFATYLLAQAHERAAYGTPFLEERGSRGTFQLHGETTVSRPSHLAHLVAVTYYARLGRQLFAESEQAAGAAEASSTAAAPLLPAELEQLGSENALASLNLSLLAAYSRLDFRQRIGPIVAGFPGLADSERAEAILDDARVEPAVRPWIFRAIHLSLRSSDEPEAYRFGVLALDAPAIQDDPDFARAAADIVHWIREESNYVFRSPAGQVFDPALPGCTVDGTPNIEFEAIPRER